MEHAIFLGLRSNRLDESGNETSDTGSEGSAGLEDTSGTGALSRAGGGGAGDGAGGGCGARGWGVGGNSGVAASWVGAGQDGGGLDGGWVGRGGVLGDAGRVGSRLGGAGRSSGVSAGSRGHGRGRGSASLASTGDAELRSVLVLSGHVVTELESIAGARGVGDGLGDDDGGLSGVGDSSSEGELGEDVVGGSLVEPDGDLVGGGGSPGNLVWDTSGDVLSESGLDGWVIGGPLGSRVDGSDNGHEGSDDGGLGEHVEDCLFIEEKD